MLLKGSRLSANLHYADLVASTDVGDAEARFAAGEYQYFDLCWYKSDGDFFQSRRTRILEKVKNVGRDHM